MHPAPDHSPTAEAAEHAALIAALDAGDLAGRERDQAGTLARTCVGCASLLEDLAVLRAATASLAVTPRTRDYRLTEADAVRLRPSTWKSLVRWLAAPRSTVRPLAGGLAALGIAGLLLTATPGFFGGSATSLTTTGAPVVASGGAEGAAGPAGGNALPGAAPSAAPTAAASAASAAARPNGAVPIGPSASAASAASPVLGAPGTTPGVAALPAPSPATVAGPAPTPIPGAGTVTGPAAAATAATGPSGFSTDAGAATDSATKAAPPEASQGGRSAVPATREQPAPQDRTVPLLLSLALLVAGLGLLAANRVLRGRA